MRHSNMQRLAGRTRSPSPISALAALACLLIAAAPAAWADQAIDERRAASSTVKVYIENTAGKVEVIGWDRKQVHVTGTLDRKALGLLVDGDEHRLEVVVELPKNVRNVGDTDLTVHVPHAARLRVAAVSADVSLSGLSGERQDVKTVSGDVTIRDVAGERLQAGSVSGNVYADSNAQSQKLESISGNVTSRGHAACKEAMLSSISGNIEAASLPARFSVATVSGDIAASADLLQRADLKTMSGDIQLTAKLTDDGELDVETLSGEADLQLADTPRRMRSRTVSGVIRNEMLDREHGGRLKLTGQTQMTSDEPGAVGDINIVSFSGDVRLRRSADQPK